MRADVSFRPRVAVTAGCPCGIGPEVVARSLLAVGEGVDVCFVGTPAVLARGAAAAGVGVVSTPVRSWPGAERLTIGQFGQPGADDLSYQCEALVAACQMAIRGEVDAIVTGPVRKKALVIGGEAFAGQTEVVAHFAGGQAPLMVFAGGPFVMGLLTVHVPLREAADLVTRDRMVRAIHQLTAAATALSAQPDRAPHVVVLGVNPHAGEGGLLGREEIDVVIPVLEALRAGGANITGPVPADGFFADLARGAAAPDAVLAMHHDQALAPYKLMARGEGINITWGTRIIRTSPDHGTADAIAGKGSADATSMRQAIALAATLVLHAQR